MDKVTEPSPPAPGRSSPGSFSGPDLIVLLHNRAAEYRYKGDRGRAAADVKTAMDLEYRLTRPIRWDQPSPRKGPGSPVPPAVGSRPGTKYPIADDGAPAPPATHLPADGMATWRTPRWMRRSDVDQRDSYPQRHLKLIQKRLREADTIHRATTKGA